MNRPERLLLAANNPMTNNELTAKRAEDSTSMVAIVLYNPLILPEDPVAARKFFPCRTSRTTIMRVRITLSESEIERYGRVGQTSASSWSFMIGSFFMIGKQIARMPITILSMQTLSTTAIREELRYVPIEPRYIRQGKAMTQQFME